MTTQSEGARQAQAALAEALSASEARLAETEGALRRARRRLAALEAQSTAHETRLRAERDRALHRLAQLEKLYQQTPVAIGLLDPDLTLLRVNEHLARLLGHSGEKARGKPLSAVSPALAAASAGLAQEVLSHGLPLLSRRIEVAFPPAGSRPRVLETDWYPFVQRGEIEGVGFAIIDETEARARSEQIEFLMHELQHRVKNVLATVMALTRQARRAPEGAEAGLAQLLERIAALARSNDLLAQRAVRTAELGQIVRTETADVYGDERVRISGPRVDLNAEAALAFSMGLHEMATNAAKHGALSVAQGTLRIAWHLEDRGAGPDLLLQWRERGGPAPQAGARGFGSGLIEVNFSRSLPGQLDRRLPIEGAEYDLRLPLAAIAARE